MHSTFQNYFPILFFFLNPGSNSFSLLLYSTMYPAPLVAIETCISHIFNKLSVLKANHKLYQSPKLYEDIKILYIVMSKSMR